MNKDRRKTIQSVLNGLLDLREQLEGARDEEQSAFDNLPEGLQGAEKGIAMETAVSSLEEALDAFDDIEAALQQAME